MNAIFHLMGNTKIEAVAQSDHLWINIHDEEGSLLTLHFYCKEEVLKLREALETLLKEKKKEKEEE